MKEILARRINTITLVLFFLDTLLFGCGAAAVPPAQPRQGITGVTYAVFVAQVSSGKGSGQRYRGEVTLAFSAAGLDVADSSLSVAPGRQLRIVSATGLSAFAIEVSRLIFLDATGNWRRGGEVQGSFLVREETVPVASGPWSAVLTDPRESGYAFDAIIPGPAGQDYSGVLSVGQSNAGILLEASGTWWPVYVQHNAAHQVLSITVDLGKGNTLLCRRGMAMLAGKASRRAAAGNHSGTCQIASLG